MAKFNTKRQYVYTVTEIDRHTIDDRPLVEIIALFQKAIEQHGKEAVFDVDIDYDGFVSFEIHSQHLETDEEYEARRTQWQKIEKAKREETKKRRQEREERDCREFERLSRKFGNKKFI